MDLPRRSTGPRHELLAGGGGGGSEIPVFPGGAFCWKTSNVGTTELNLRAPLR